MTERTCTCGRKDFCTPWCGDTTIELDLLRLNLDTALAHLDGAISTMSLGLLPKLSVPLARQEITKARDAANQMRTGQRGQGGRGGVVTEDIEVIEIKGGWLARAAYPGLATVGATKEEAVAKLQESLVQAQALLEKYRANEVARTDA